MGFWIEDGEKILFIGDSITDCGRQAEDAPLGAGYVRLFAGMTTAAHPDRMIRYINKGIGGNQVTDLQDRWTDDVLHHEPDKLSIKIGINDLHGVLRDNPDAVPPARFEKVYNAVLERTRGSLNCPIVLITPFYLSVDAAEDSFCRRVLDLIPAYIDVVERMSAKFSTRIVRLQDVFREQLKYRDPETFCPDPVHPNGTGHLVIANALFNALSE